MGNPWKLYRFPPNVFFDRFVTQPVFTTKFLVSGKNALTNFYFTLAFWCDAL